MGWRGVLGWTAVEGQRERVRWVDLQDAAVRMTRRAQWFLMSLPMLAACLRGEVVGT